MGGQELEHDPDFHPGQRRAEAVVDALSEGKIGARVAAVDVERLGFTEPSRVPAGRPEQQQELAELNRLSPPLWGLAEAARCQGDYGTAVTLCERGYRASADVMDAAYLYPYLLTGVRAHLAEGDIDAAQNWSDRVGALLTARAIPGTLPAISHGRGLVLLARGDEEAARQALESASESWQAQRRFWEGTWSRLDLAQAAARARRRGEAAVRLEEARTVAATAGATAVIDAADRLAASFDHAADRTVVPADRTRIRGRPAHRDRPHQPADRRTSRTFSPSWVPHAAPRSRRGARLSGTPVPVTDDQARSETAGGRRAWPVSVGSPPFSLPSLMFA